jgi:hypothetical protein
MGPGFWQPLNEYFSVLLRLRLLINSAEVRLGFEGNGPADNSAKSWKFKLVKNFFSVLHLVELDVGEIEVFEHRST